jgi:hypothetical protein
MVLLFLAGQLLHELLFLHLHLLIRLHADLYGLLFVLDLSVDDVGDFRGQIPLSEEVAGLFEEAISSAFELADGELSHFVA